MRIRVEHLPAEASAWQAVAVEHPDAEVRAAASAAQAYAWALYACGMQANEEHERLVAAGALPPDPPPRQPLRAIPGGK